MQPTTEGPAGSDSEIYTIDPTGGMPFNVTDNDTDDGAPDYSPNGTKIAYVSPDVFGNYEIYTINVGGGGKSRVTNDDTSDSGPSWGSRP
jgi:Tol biopolymer transport system component